MATQITCIIPDSSDPDNRIDSVGGKDWTKSEDVVIAEIESGSEYFVEVDGASVSVEVDQRSNGTKFLRTDSDETTANNLLSLPTCPA
jgi:hypothetical protein